MAYEYRTPAGVLRLQKVEQNWTVEFDGCHSANHASPDAAAAAAAQHATGLASWDGTLSHVPDDLLSWRPLGDSL
jgi:hypothetical protein